MVHPNGLGKFKKSVQQLSVVQPTFATHHTSDTADSIDLIRIIRLKQTECWYIREMPHKIGVFANPWSDQAFQIQTGEWLTYSNLKDFVISYGNKPTKNIFIDEALFENMYDGYGLLDPEGPNVHLVSRKDSKACFDVYDNCPYCFCHEETGNFAKMHLLYEDEEESLGFSAVEVEMYCDTLAVGALSAKRGEHMFRVMYDRQYIKVHSGALKQFQQANDGFIYDKSTCTFTVKDEAFKIRAGASSGGGGLADDSAIQPAPWEQLQSALIELVVKNVTYYDLKATPLARFSTQYFAWQTYEFGESSPKAKRSRSLNVFELEICPLATGVPGNFKRISFGT